MTKSNRRERIVIVPINSARHGEWKVFLPESCFLNNYGGSAEAVVAAFEAEADERDNQAKAPSPDDIF